LSRFENLSLSSQEEGHEAGICWEPEQHFTTPVVIFPGIEKSPETPAVARIFPGAEKSPETPLDRLWTP
jgi:hypothetical protein